MGRMICRLIHSVFASLQKRVWNNFFHSSGSDLDTNTKQCNAASKYRPCVKKYLMRILFLYAVLYSVSHYYINACFEVIYIDIRGMELQSARIPSSLWQTYCLLLLFISVVCLGRTIYGMLA